jgi:hypothetical protein
VNGTETIAEMARRLLAAVETARLDLKAIVAAANEKVGSAEASVLVMNEANSHLQFLVSMNENLDNGELEIARGEAISGFVFESGQVVAKAHPDSVGAGKVAGKSGVTTDYLLAVPVMADGRVVAVGTFVNRSSSSPDQGFIREELDIAQYFAGLYAVGLKTHRQAVMTYRIASTDLCSLARQMGIDPSGIAGLNEDLRFARGFEDTIFNIGNEMSQSQRSTWKRFGSFLLSEPDEEDLD